MRTPWLQESHNLHNMRQDRDEPIRNFGAMLRGQAGVCKFFMQCPGCSKDVNYTDQILRDVVTRGIVDTDLQLDLLGDCNQNMTLEEVLRIEKLTLFNRDLYYVYTIHLKVVVVCFVNSMCTRVWPWGPVSPVCARLSTIGVTVCLCQGVCLVCFCPGVCLYQVSYRV